MAARFFETRAKEGLHGEVIRLKNGQDLCALDLASDFRSCWGLVEVGRVLELEETRELEVVKWILVKGSKL